MPKLRRIRWETFAQGVVSGLSASEAYRRSGFDAKTPSAVETGAYRLSRRADVAARIDELQEEAIKASALSKKWVLDRLKENSERAMQRVPVLDADGKNIGVWTWQGAVANKALELIGSELGMFVEHIEQDTNIRVISAEPMTPEMWRDKYGVKGEEPLKLNGPALRVINGSVRGMDEDE